MTDKPRKPTLALVRGVPTLEEIARLFEALTGHPPTPEDMAEVAAVVREHEGSGVRDGDGGASGNEEAL
jgi:hypothetical protein